MIARAPTTHRTHLDTRPPVHSAVEAMSAARTKGRKRPRVEQPFTFEQGLTLLLDAGNGALSALLVAATRSFDQPLELSQRSLLPLQPPSLQPVPHSDSNGGSGHRRNAGDVDEEGLARPTAERQRAERWRCTARPQRQSRKEQPQ